MRNLSKVNQNDWNAAVQITKNTDLEKNILLYMKMASKYVVDIPCYITSETLLKCSNAVKKYLGSTPFPFRGSFLEMGQLNFEKPCRFALEQFYSDIGCIQALGSILENSDIEKKHRIAACNGHTEILKILVPLTDNPNAPNNDGRTPIYWAAFYDHTEIVKILEFCKTSKKRKAGASSAKPNKKRAKKV